MSGPTGFSYRFKPRAVVAVLLHVLVAFFFLKVDARSNGEASAQEVRLGEIYAPVVVQLLALDAVLSIEHGRLVGTNADARRECRQVLAPIRVSFVFLAVGVAPLLAGAYAVLGALGLDAPSVIGRKLIVLVVVIFTVVITNHSTVS